MPPQFALMVTVASVLSSAVIVWDVTHVRNTLGVRMGPWWLWLAAQVLAFPLSAGVWLVVRAVVRARWEVARHTGRR
jgi:hypothetical protein